MSECCYFMLGGANPGLPRAFMYAFNMFWFTLVAVSALMGSLVHKGYYFISIGCVMLIVITCASYSIYRTCMGRRLRPVAPASDADGNDSLFGPPPPYEAVMIRQPDGPPDYTEAICINTAPKESLPGNVESERLLSDEPQPTAVEVEK
ncbi:uncharacterized protein LOC144113089 isoform X2 [Amblyomma americanum]